MKTIVVFINADKMKNYIRLILFFCFFMQWNPLMGQDNSTGKERDKKGIKAYDVKVKSDTSKYITFKYYLDESNRIVQLKPQKNAIPVSDLYNLNSKIYKGKSYWFQYSTLEKSKILKGGEIDLDAAIAMISREKRLYDDSPFQDVPIINNSFTWTDLLDKKLNNLEAEIDNLWLRVNPKRNSSEWRALEEKECKGKSKSDIIDFRIIYIKLLTLEAKIDILWVKVYPKRNSSEWRALEEKECKGKNKIERVKYRTDIVEILEKKLK